MMTDHESTAGMLARLDEHLFERAPVPLACLDEPGCITYANHALARFLGRPADYLLGRPLITFVAQPDRRRLVSYLARIATGEHCEFELTMTMPHGTELPVMIMSAPLGEGPAGSRSQCALIDVSRLKATEKTLSQARDHLDHLAHHDALTGLPNRYLFEDRLELALSRCRRHGWLGALIFADIDHFKHYNDTYGHHIGDSVLIEAATRLTMNVRENDTVCRYSGDEFLLILENVTSRADVDAVMAKLREEFSRPVYGITDKPLDISGSFGATLFDKNTRDSDSLVKEADVAMYDAKSQRRNDFAFYSPQVNAAAIRRRAIEAELKQALAGEEFRLVYQPQVDLRSGQVIGCESLLRWDNATLGAVGPDEFIEIAENMGTIEPISRWVLNHACNQAVDWRRRGISGRLAVNVSARDVSFDDLVDYVSAALKHSGLEPAMLEIEVTESSIMHHPASARRVLTELVDMGVGLALDDFGTGYSSLRCLKEFPFDRIKIDQSFVEDLPDNAETRAIVSAMVSMASNLGIGILAEGVETRPQVECLQHAGIQFAQGYLFGRPLAPTDYPGFTASARARYPGRDPAGRG